MADPDLVLDYGLLHTLAGNVRTLKSQIEADVTAGSGGRVVGTGGPVDSAAAGDSGLYGALGMFFWACRQPFKDSLDRLDQLSGLFDSVANAYFDVDADLAGKVNAGRLPALIGQWQNDQAAWDRYQELKAKGEWPDDQPPPPNPGAMPTSLDGDGVHTTATVDDQGRVVSETTTVTTPGGQTYTSTTNFTYTPTSVDRDGDGKNDFLVDYDSTITHADGSTETVTQRASADGSSRTTSTTGDGTTTTTTSSVGTDGSYRSVTVTPSGETTTTTVESTGEGTGRKTVVGPDGTTVYTGNPLIDQWTPVGSPGAGPPPTPSPSPGPSPTAPTSTTPTASPAGGASPAAAAPAPPTPSPTPDPTP